jgi:hypothetical protein
VLDTLSAYALYVPTTVLRWPEDGYYIAETCRHTITYKPGCFMNNVVFVDGRYTTTFGYKTTGWLLSKLNLV